MTPRLNDLVASCKSSGPLKDLVLNKLSFGGIKSPKSVVLILNAQYWAKARTFDMFWTITATQNCQQSTIHPFIIGMEKGVKLSRHLWTLRPLETDNKRHWIIVHSIPTIWDRREASTERYQHTKGILSIRNVTAGLWRHLTPEIKWCM